MSAFIDGHECDGQVFQIHLQKGNSMPWVKFVLKIQNSNRFLNKNIAVGRLKQPNAYAVREICVPTDQCIQLILRDMGNDGLCCDHGISFYKITQVDSNQVVAANVMQQKKSQIVKFGGC